ncbi:recombinase family protein [Paludicola sp. MB14-C6]|uniref:recombinase family protein n=1 Tax=Paludihabitans sp. MB14-C6 TaxID=3070656 RepID=UPI0027DC3A30|nr:recombinase family protein [Paludicola sp. MB14-C6]WMJ22929.1 recombinase family protein [Paludicola sp. MB14-C6]
MKVAIYCRLSEEDKNKQLSTDDSESIQNQKEMLLQYAIEQGWEIYNIYSDDDYAGADRNRPEFNKLLADAKQRKFDIVLCKTQSRFTRELELVEKYIHGLFPIWNIRFVSIVDNADTANKGNKKSRQINGLVNEWYLEDMSENIKSVFDAKRKNGYHIGSFALYGYKKDPNQKGHLLIDEEAAEIVREVFTLFSLGYGKTAIAQILNERGVPNPTEYKRLQGLRYKAPETKQSTLWKYFSISHMLVNEIYIGNMVQGKYGSISYKTKQNKPKQKEQWYKVEGTHEPIIDQALWNRVQSLIGQRVKPFTIGTIGIFAKKVKCMNCGYTMRSAKSHDRYYLKCSSKIIAKDSCIGSFVSVEALEEIVMGELNKLCKEYLDRDELEANIEFHNNIKAKIQKCETKLAQYQKKIAELSKCIRELYIDKMKKLITEKEYVEFSEEFSKDRVKFEKLEAEMEKQIAQLRSEDLIENNHRKLIEEYIHIEKLNREIVEKLIDYILVGKKDTKTQVLPVEIFWNF